MNAMVVTSMGLKLNFKGLVFKLERLGEDYEKQVNVGLCKVIMIL